jgi:hypothetical protein
MNKVLGSNSSTIKKIPGMLTVGPVCRSSQSKLWQKMGGLTQGGLQAERKDSSKNSWLKEKVK